MYQSKKSGRAGDISIFCMILLSIYLGFQVFSIRFYAFGGSFLVFVGFGVLTG